MSHFFKCRIQNFTEISDEKEKGIKDPEAVHLVVV